MYLPRVIPCLLLKDQGLYKTTRFKKPVYLGDPINTLKIFNDKGVDELILLDIEATIQKRAPDFSYLQEIATECFMPLAYGGGIRTLEDIEKIIASGFEKVCLNTVAFECPQVVKKASQVFGAQSVVASIDFRRSWTGKAQVVVACGKKKTGKDVVEYAKQMQALGVGEIFLNSIDREGTMGGYDLEVIEKVTQAVSVPVIASGGAGTLNDFSLALEKGKAAAVAAGSFFVFQGKHRAVLINVPSENELRTVFQPRLAMVGQS